MKQDQSYGSTRRWRGPDTYVLESIDSWLELKKDENGNEISCTSILWDEKERMGFVDLLETKVI